MSSTAYTRLADGVWYATPIGEAFDRVLLENEDEFMIVDDSEYSFSPMELLPDVEEDNDLRRPT